nr:MAG TPA: hypothetical protein [Caudoviricetes sp.]
MNWISMIHEKGSYPTEYIAEELTCFLIIIVNFS